MEDGNGTAIQEQVTEQITTEVQPTEVVDIATEPTSDVGTQVAPEPAQWPEPQYVTPEQLAMFKSEINGLLEQVRRESQSLTDKNVNRLRKEISEKTKVFDEMVADPELASYLGDDYEAFKRRKHSEIVARHFADYQPEPEIPSQPQQPTREDLLMREDVKDILRMYNISLTDPEFVHPADTSGIREYRALIELAAMKKTQRLAQQQKQQPKPEPAPVPARAPAQVSLGTGSGPRPKTKAELIAELANTNRNDRETREALRKQIIAMSNEP